MLDNIRFCYCSRIDSEEDKASQCMFFGFTERARKILTDEFLFEITDTSPEENLQKSGIPLLEKEINNGDKVFIKKVDGNLYRIPTRFIEPFIRCLFKYLPAYYVSPGEHDSSDYCDLQDQDDET